MNFLILNLFPNLFQVFLFLSLQMSIKIIRIKKEQHDFFPDVSLIIAYQFIHHLFKNDLHQICKKKGCK